MGGDPVAVLPRLEYIFIRCLRRIMLLRENITFGFVILFHEKHTVKVVRKFVRLKTCLQILY